MGVRPALDRCSSGRLLLQEDFARAREALSWHWQPDSCNLYDFRPINQNFGRVGNDARTNSTLLGLQQLHLLLEKLGPKKIIFVGDSLTLEQYLSLEVRRLTHSNELWWFCFLKVELAGQEG